AGLEITLEGGAVLLGELGEQREAGQCGAHGTSLANTLRSTSSRSLLAGACSTKKEPPSRCGKLPRAESESERPGASGRSRWTVRGLSPRSLSKLVWAASGAAPTAPAGRMMAPSMPFAATSQSGS